MGQVISLLLYQMKEVSLFPGGSKQRVTDNNKMDYLNELAQHRLVKTVTEEVRAFIKG